MITRGGGMTLHTAGPQPQLDTASPADTALVTVAMPGYADLEARLIAIEARVVSASEVDALRQILFNQGYGLLALRERVTQLEQMLIGKTDTVISHQFVGARPADAKP
ncbi:MAG: hypothetical protein Q8R78_02750 [Candidatus Omnitrophota bacterium]|nr:hypothetical protein [Candidatus Omnitrophota bacterium]